MSQGSHERSVSFTGAGISGANVSGQFRRVVVFSFIICCMFSFVVLCSLFTQTTHYFSSGVKYFAPSGNICYVSLFVLRFLFSFFVVSHVSFLKNCISLVLACNLLPQVERFLDALMGNY